MSSLRKLAVCYLVSVSAFGLAAGLRAWPDAVDEAARLFDRQVWRPAADALARADRALLDAPESNAHVTLALKPPVPAAPVGGERTLAHVDLPKIERPGLALSPDTQLALDTPVMIAPVPVSLPKAAPPTPAPQLAQATPDPALTPEQARARARLAAALTPEMREHFGLFIFVSKASKGPLAQRAYIFKQDLNNKKDGGALTLLYDWAASTGREKAEKDAQGDAAFTATPAGLYQFDPGRMYRQYHSTNWDQDMPNAMFFNWQRDGMQTGLAIHAATGDDVARLGTRASAGCVHLSPENARTLFALVKGDYRGAVPRFAIDASDTMSSKGKFSRRPDGSLRMADGYRVLIDIENYGGSEGGDAVALF